MKRSHSQNLRKVDRVTTLTFIPHKLSITVFVGVLMSCYSLADDKTKNTESQTSSPTAHTKIEAETSKTIVKVDPYAHYKKSLLVMTGDELNLEIARVAKLLETEADKEGSKFSEKRYEEYSEKLEICRALIKNQTAQLKKENAKGTEKVTAIQKETEQLKKELTELQKQDAAIIAENKRLEQEAKNKK